MVAVPVAAALIVVCASLCRSGNEGNAEKRNAALSEREQRRLLRREARIRKHLSAEEAVREAMKGVKIPKRERGKRVKRINYDDLFAHLKGVDRTQAEAVQKALDEEDFKAVVEAAKVSLQSENPEVRENAIDALGWFGAEALPELTTCMADKDEDVAQSAMHQWEYALADIEDARERLVISVAALATITDKDALESISGQFSNSATEYIDDEEDEEKAMVNRVEVVQALLDLMDDGDERHAQVAEETYEDITGNKWLGVDEAEKYLRDPDNYEEPEDAEDRDEG